MCSGRFLRSGSVVYSSRTKPVKRAAAQPQQPEATRRRTRPRRCPYGRSRCAPSRASGPEGRNATPRPTGAYGISDRRHLQPSTCGYIPRNLSPRKRQYASRSYAVEIHRLALDEVLHRVGRDRARCCRPRCRSARTRRRRRSISTFAPNTGLLPSASGRRG